MLRCCFIFVIAAALAPPFVRAAETLKIGDKAPNWSDLQGTDGKPYALADFKDKTALVIVFTCNSCPYANDYEERLIAFAKQYCFTDGKTALIAINSNRVKEDSFEAMQKRAEKQKYNFPYVWDETQATARAYGANYTPEFYVFDKDRKLVYRGAFDDNSNPDLAAKHYVADAVEATLADKTPAVQETQAVGCAVRYERTKRGKK